MSLSSPEADRRPLRVATDASTAAGAQAEPRAPLVRLELQEMGFEPGAPILGPLTLEVRAGETLAITGPSGVGKSTLLRIIAGLESRYRGRLTTPPRLAMVFQEPTLLPWRSALDNVRLSTGLGVEAARRALAEVGLSAQEKQYPTQMSLGQQRRLSLARAFGSDPDVLLMDEPFVSLDPDLAEDMMVLFARLRAARGLATILVTHVEREAEMLASRIVALTGSPATLGAERQNKGAYFQLSASGVTSSRS
ncbi:ABC transporter ATP-binding protein [Dinoroseobacter shibae]|uniref:ABC transporter ATP-binding protein n=1 Tax=Dinoroseobacter shibae TaxID=215813 RepID=UPI0000E8F556|nr:ATP-binding cassette domain-containing protein [Dinoroseobacter shibae]